MKKLLIVACISLSTYSYAQITIIKQAIIKTSLTVTNVENDNLVNIEDNRPSRFSANGDASTTIWLKNNLIKTETVTDNSVSTTIRDNNKKTTTSLTEAMGRKTGFFLTDEDQEKINVRRDSILKSRSTNQNNTPAPTEATIVYLDDTKKIAGIVCKKALLVNTRNNGRSDTTEVWFYPGYTFEGLNGAGIVGTSGPFAGGANRFRNLKGLNQLTGFPMQFEINMNRGRKITVEVTKIDMKQPIKDSEFETPKGFEIKTAKDMQKDFGSGRLPANIER